MTAVIFLNTLYRPSDEQLRMLYRIQDEIYFQKVHLYQTTRHLPPNVQHSMKEQFHQTFRNTWKVVPPEDEPQDKIG